MLKGTLGSGATQSFRCTECNTYH